MLISNVVQLVSHFVGSNPVEYWEQAAKNLARSFAKRDDDSGMVSIFGQVLAMQILEMPPVVRYHAQPLCYTIGELFWIWITQPTSVSRRN